MHQKAMLAVLNSLTRKIQRSRNMPEPALIAEFRRLAQDCREPGDYEALKSSVDMLLEEFNLQKTEHELRKR